MIRLHRKPLLSLLPVQQGGHLQQPSVPLHGALLPPVGPPAIPSAAGSLLTSALLLQLLLPAHLAEGNGPDAPEPTRGYKPPAKRAWQACRYNSGSKGYCLAASPLKHQPHRFHILHFPPAGLTVGLTTAASSTSQP